MNKEIRPGYYQDAAGEWQIDRRSGKDRRALSDTASHEQRREFRRKADRELYEKDHKRMINEALEDFAEEHDGHL